MTIAYKNTISEKYYKKKVFKKNKLILKKYLKKTSSSLNFRKDFFYSLSKNYKFSFDLKQYSKYKKFKNVILIGMGGSILGSEAIYCFLKDKIKKNFLFFNNLDETKKYNFNNSKNYLFIIISKSGNTLETITNVNLIKKKILTSKNTIIISSKNNNALYFYSKKNNIPFVEHKKYIGGRYSVLSEAGMLPAYLMGLDPRKIRSRILENFNSKKSSFLIDSASKLSQIYLSKKINSLVFLNYSPYLNKFLYWCQQLIAESLGKNGKGLLPLISVAPKDHHSLLQLYLDGPKDKIFYIFSNKSKINKKVSFNHFDNRFNYIKNKNFKRIVGAQKKALIDIFRKKNIPFREIELAQSDEKNLGELFSYFMIETILIGKLMNVNPFDQPSVESVKIITKKYLN